MSKTIKQIADELGISKQRVYRYIKNNHINEAHQKNGVMYYNEVAETVIKSAFNKNDTSNDAHQDSHQTTSNDIGLKQFEVIIDTLKKQIETKDSQINQLQQLLDQQQRLTLAQLEQKEILQIENKKPWWKKKKS